MKVDGPQVLRFLGPEEKSMAGGTLGTTVHDQGSKTGAMWQVEGTVWRAYLNDWACQRKLLALVISWANLLKSSPSNDGNTESLRKRNKCYVRPIK